MKKISGLLGLLMTAMLVLALFPASALASADYNAHDKDAVKAFLEQASAISGKTNAQALGSGVNVNDPSTWPGVTWTNIGAPTGEYISSIYWEGKSLAGSLDMSYCSQLGQVDIHNNSITALDVAHNSFSLFTVKASFNPLTSLNVTDCYALQTLECHHSALTSLDVSGCSALGSLDCSYTNTLQTLNVAGLTGLTTLDCYKCDISTLDVSAASGLTQLYCQENSLTALDVSHSTALEELDCGNNSLTALDVSHNTVLKWLDCGNNSLTALDVSHNTVLKRLFCAKDSLTALDVSHNTALTELYCSDNSLTALDISGLNHLFSLACSNNNISSIHLYSPQSQVYCSGNHLTGLDVSACVNLQILVCDNNQLESLDLSGNVVLGGLLCGNNKLSLLDLSANTGLGALICNGNLLKQIDANIGGSSVKVSAGDNGYAELYLIVDADSASDLLGMEVEDGYYAKGVPAGSAAFCDWTQGGAQVSTSAKYDLTLSTAYDIKANFLGLASSVENGTINTGEKIILTPSVEGGTWDWDKEYLSATFNSPATFTGLKAGTTTVTYTAGGFVISYNVTIKAPVLKLSSSVASGTINTGGRITLTPNVEGGTWSFDSAYLSRDGNTFTGLKAGTATVTYTVLGVSISYNVTIEAPVLTLTSSVANGTIYTGGRITLTPNVEGGTWSFDSAYLSRDGNTFTGLKAGTATVTYTVLGVSKDYQIIIKASELPSTGQNFTWVWLLAAVAVIALGSAAWLWARRIKSRA